MKFSQFNPLPNMNLPTLNIPRLGVSVFRSRLLVRGIFIALMFAVVALAVVLLNEEKQRSYQHYQNNIGRTQAEVMAKLRHPAGVLALLNARFMTPAATPETDGVGLNPLLLPFGALDFDDLYKAQQAVEMSGCSMHFANQSSLCVGVGSNPYAGGFIYLVGQFQTEALAGRDRGQLDLTRVHHARLQINVRGHATHWLAPLEILPATETSRMSLRGTTVGRLPGFLMERGIDTQLERETRPDRDFRAWMWQRQNCEANHPASDPQSATTACVYRTWFSMRVPVPEFQAELFNKQRALNWPPPDLNRTKVTLQMLAPAPVSVPTNITTTAPTPTLEESVTNAPPTPAPLIVFDSQHPQTQPPFSLQDLSAVMQPGEILQIYPFIHEKNSAAQVAHQTPLYTVRGQVIEGNISPFITRLIHWLPVQAVPNKIERRDRLSTPVGNYEVVFQSDIQGIDNSLSAVATRLSWFVAAMLGALLFAWMLIELGVMRRIARLTKRAATVSYNMPDAQIDSSGATLKQFEFNDLRGSDEIGILAGSLDNLLQRVKEDVQRAQIRAQQEREMWHAVGHEIMSPLQSLMVLHPKDQDPSHRYIQRMQQAVKVLYGQASPSEAIEAAHLELGSVDLVSFLTMIAENSHFAGIQEVRFIAPANITSLLVRADEFSLEDVLTHVLRNAVRYRLPETPITLNLSTSAGQACIAIHNQGPQIPANMLEKIFEYGVSDSDAEINATQRGQGLFVARTYLAKMGGTICAENVVDGVQFYIQLPVIA